MAVGAYLGETAQDYEFAGPVNLPAETIVNTMGVWTQLIASTTFDAQGFLLGWEPNDSTILNAEGLFDIGIGPDGSVRVVVNHLLISWSSGSGRQMEGHGYFPVSIPAGTRISGRSQATTISLGVNISSLVMVAGDQGFAECTTFGSNAGTSDGTGVDPGASAGTKGAWQQMVASTPHDIFAISYGITRDGVDRTLSVARGRLDIGVGANPNEVVVIPDLPFWSQSSQDMHFPFHGAGPIPCYIPAGSRLVARTVSSINTAGDRVPGVVLYGFGA